MRFPSEGADELLCGLYDLCEGDDLEERVAVPEFVPGCIAVHLDADLEG